MRKGYLGSITAAKLSPQSVEVYDEDHMTVKRVPHSWRQGRDLSNATRLEYHVCGIYEPGRDTTSYLLYTGYEETAHSICSCFAYLWMKEAPKSPLVSIRMDNHSTGKSKIFWQFVEYLMRLRRLPRSCMISYPVAGHEADELDRKHRLPAQRFARSDIFNMNQMLEAFKSFGYHAYELPGILDFSFFSNVCIPDSKFPPMRDVHYVELQLSQDGNPWAADSLRISMWNSTAAWRGNQQPDSELSSFFSEFPDSFGTFKMIEPTLDRPKLAKTMEVLPVDQRAWMQKICCGDWPSTSSVESQHFLSSFQHWMQRDITEAGGKSVPHQGRTDSTSAVVHSADSSTEIHDEHVRVAEEKCTSFPGRNLIARMPQDKIHGRLIAVIDHRHKKVHNQDHVEFEVDYKPHPDEDNVVEWKDASWFENNDNLPIAEKDAALICYKATHTIKTVSTKPRGSKKNATSQHRVVDDEEERS